MGKIRDIISLLRVRQWYKSAVLFMGPIFSEAIFNFNYYPALILGFFVISFASSFNYILNDLMDIEADRQHPEKAQKRPLAAGRISKVGGVVLLIIVGVFAFGGGYLFLALPVFWMVVAIVSTGLIYNFVLKHHAFVDILTVSIIYIWRAIAGCYIVSVKVSPWLFIAVFLLALYLVICKRRADLELIGEDAAANHKKVYKKYSIKLLDQLHVMIATSLFLVYTLYIITPSTSSSSIISHHQSFLIFSIPVALYLIMRYSYLTTAKPEVARRTERALLDRGMIIGGVILLLIFVLAFYFNLDLLNVFPT